MSFVLLVLVIMGLCLMNGVAESQADIQAQLVRAASLREKGNLGEAGKIYEVLLPRLRTQPASRELGETLIGLGQIANADGHYESAVSLARESAQIYQTVGDPDGQARAHNDAGFAYMNAGSYTEAAKELDVAFNLNRPTGNAKTAVLILNNTGSVCYYQAKYSESFRAYEAAMQRLDQAGSAPWTPYWRKVTLFNLAVLYQRLGDDQRALGVYQELQQSPSGLEQRDLGLLNANMGVLYRHLGDPQKALAAYRKAEHFYGQEHDVEGELGVKMNTGIVLALELANFDGALKTFTQIRELAAKAKSRRAAMQALLYRAETLYRKGDLSSAKEQFTQALMEAGELGTVEEQWKALYALGRIAEKEGQPSLAEAKYTEAIHKIESIRSRIQLSRLRSGFLVDKRDVYDAIIKLLLLRNDVNDAFQYMERSRARVFQDRFSGGTSQAPAVGLEFVQSKLDSSTAVVEFWTGQDSVAAIWVTRASTGFAQRQLTAEEMEAFTRIAGHLPDSLGEDWKSVFTRLNDFLPRDITPFSDDRYRHLVIVPDGFLSLVPFDLALNNSGRPLLEDHDVSYLPTAILLSRRSSSASRRVRFPWEQQVIAFGDPAINLNSALPAVVSNTNEAVRLPGATAEIEQLAKMSNGRTRTYLGTADRKESFIQATRMKTALLHVSTHAMADLDNPERSRLLFSPEESQQGSDFLFLKELYDLDLRDVDLVVLSACDTERGKLVPGEGVQAFSRALLADGSPSAITTLWRVPDQPSSEFINQFYFYLLKEHRSKAEALRLAKLEFLHSGGALKDPRYWAAFILNGDGSDNVPRFLSWQLIVLPLPIAAFLIAAWWRLRRRGMRV